MHNRMDPLDRPGHTHGVPSQAAFAVASYNIHKGVGTDRRRDLLRTASVIAELNADVLALQEADTRFGTRTGLLDLKHLAEDAGLEAVPLQGTGLAHGWHGNVLLLRNALVQDVHQITLPGLEPRGAMVTDIEIAGQPLRIVNAHLGLLPQSRTMQAKAMLDKLNSMQQRPTLLMGDLNEWRTNAQAMRLFGHLFTHAQTPPSFPARFPLLALDRMMTSAHARLEDARTHISALSRRASDHLPVTARMQILHQGDVGVERGETP